MTRTIIIIIVIIGDTIADASAAFVIVVAVAVAVVAAALPRLNHSNDPSDPFYSMINQLGQKIRNRQNLVNFKSIKSKLGRGITHVVPYILTIIVPFYPVTVLKMRVCV